MNFRANIWTFVSILILCLFALFIWYRVEPIVRIAGEKVYVVVTDTIKIRDTVRIVAPAKTKIVRDTIVKISEVLEKKDTIFVASLDTNISKSHLQVDYYFPINRYEINLETKADTIITYKQITSTKKDWWLYVIPFAIGLGLGALIR